MNRLLENAIEKNIFFIFFIVCWKRRIKEVLLDRNQGYKLSEADVRVQRANSIRASDHNESYDVEQFQK